MRQPIFVWPPTQNQNRACMYVYVNKDRLFIVFSFHQRACLKSFRQSLLIVSKFAEQWLMSSKLATTKKRPGRFQGPLSTCTCTCSSTCKSTCIRMHMHKSACISSRKCCRAKNLCATTLWLLNLCAPCVVDCFQPPFVC